MVDQLIVFGEQHPGRKYKALNQHTMNVQLLESGYKDIAASVQLIMDRVKKYGGTSTSDGLSSGYGIQSPYLAFCNLF